MKMGASETRSRHRPQLGANSRDPNIPPWQSSPLVPLSRARCRLYLFRGQGRLDCGRGLVTTTARTEQPAPAAPWRPPRPESGGLKWPEVGHGKDSVQSRGHLALVVNKKQERQGHPPASPLRSMRPCPLLSTFFPLNPVRKTRQAPVPFSELCVTCTSSKMHFLQMRPPCLVRRPPRVVRSPWPRLGSPRGVSRVSGWP